MLDGVPGHDQPVLGFPECTSISSDNDFRQSAPNCVVLLTRGWTGLSQSLAGVFLSRGPAHPRGKFMQDPLLTPAPVSSLPVSNLDEASEVPWVGGQGLLPCSGLPQLGMFSSEPVTLIHTYPIYLGTILKLTWSFRYSVDTDPPNVERDPSNVNSACTPKTRKAVETVVCTCGMQEQAGALGQGLCGWVILAMCLWFWLGQKCLPSEWEKPYICVTEAPECLCLEDDSYTADQLWLSPSLKLGGGSLGCWPCQLPKPSRHQESPKIEKVPRAAGLNQAPGIKEQVTKGDLFSLFNTWKQLSLHLRSALTQGTTNWRGGGSHRSPLFIRSFIHS